MLTQAQIHPYYTTGENEPRDLFLTGLMNSQEFDLGLGYFRSTGFGVLAIGFADFICRGGKMRFLINNTLYHKDKDALLKGIERSPEELIEEDLLNDLDQLKKVLKKRDAHFFNCLSWMISTGTLEIKAVRPAKNKRGIVHYKMGYFTDSEKNRLAFLGSVNFSQYALQNNVEALSTELSWDTSERVQNKIGGIKNTLTKAWEGTSDAVVHIPLTEIKAAIQKKFKVKDLDDLVKVEMELINDLLNDPDTKEKTKTQLKELQKKYSTKKAKTPIKAENDKNKISLRPYQEEAIKEWGNNSFKGMLEMATGTGKTFTALAAISELKKQQDRVQIIISCPFIHLAEQWVEEAQKFGFDNAILVGESRKIWEDKAARQAKLFKREKIDQVVLITTNASFKSDTFQKIITPSIDKTLIIVDEAHYVGATGLRDKLPNCPYRLGLSATPERHGDELGTIAILDYFERVVFTLGLDKAIGEFLTEYYYYPIPIELTAKEFDEYADLSKKIMQIGNAKTPEVRERVKMLLIKRAKIQNNSENKLRWLETELEDKPLDYSLFYAGDQIFTKAKQILGKELGVKIHEFTSRQNRKQRKKLLTDFSNQEIQSLMAMKCLDEGVDVPPTRVAYFLASSSNPREFIQRRGRVLRLSEGKDYAMI